MNTQISVYIVNNPKKKEYSTIKREYSKDRNNPRRNEEYSNTRE
jgi:hypothetical protein